MIAWPGVVTNGAEFGAKNAGRKRCDGPLFNAELPSLNVLAFAPHKWGALPVVGLMS
jgi:hypothetical protein